MKGALKFILIFILTINFVSAQDSYKVSRLSISDLNDDFSPFIWNENLVFTSERPNKMFLIEYSDSKQNSGVSSIFKARIINDTTFSSPESFSKLIQSNHHDGPASFTLDNKYIYYSRPRDISNSAEVRNDEENYLAIYESEWDGEKWKNINRMPFIDTNYIYTHPAISAKGDYMVFVANLPESIGRADLFISRKVGGKWQAPVSLGDQINSKANEFFPYIHFNGDLYFASNKNGDFDIYKSEYDGSSWAKPIALPEPINSKSDDYSFFMNQVRGDGYFSSNRGGAFDLYYYTKPREEIDCELLIEESFCYTFPEVSNEEFEGLPLKYRWAVNGEQPIPESQIVFCFPSEGRYSVNLNIYDTIYDKVIFTKDVYEFLVERVRQPYIHIADEVRVNEWVDLDANGTYIPDMEIEGYNWEFGDGNNGEGVQVKHMYKNTGKYRISLTVYGSPENGIIPELCSYKEINVTEDADMDQVVPYNAPLDLAAFIKSIEYETLPDDIGLLNILGAKDELMMTHLFDSNEKLGKGDEKLSALKDTSLVHIIKNDENEYSYYYGASVSIRDAYKELVVAWEAGFSNASLKNFKYTRLKNDEYYLSAIEDGDNKYSIVLKRTDEPIEDFKKVFEKVPDRVGEINEKYVEGEGYYYTVGVEKGLNEAFSVYSEVKNAGFTTIRVKEFKEEETLHFDAELGSEGNTSSFMVELFTAKDYLEEDDPLLQLVKDKKVIPIRIDDSNVGYFIEGGDNLLEAKEILKEIKERGFEKAMIRKFKYKKLNEDGFFISKMDEGYFSYLLSFDSTSTPTNNIADSDINILGYKIYEKYDPVSKKYFKQIDAGENLTIAVALSKQLSLDSSYVVNIDRMRYEPLNDDEFFIDALDEGDEQFTLVLGSYKKKQNIYETFNGYSSSQDIREFYDEATKRYSYIVGGYESLDEVFLEKQKAVEFGLSEAFIQRFIFDPLDPDQYVLAEVNEEQEVFRITLNRIDQNADSLNSKDEDYDKLRDDGVLIDSYDLEKDEYVVSLGKSRSLPLALKHLSAALEMGYSSAKIEKYIYSSLEDDQFVIRDLDEEDSYKCVELFHSDSLLSMSDPKLKNLSRKYPISYSYNEPTKDYVYVIGPLNDKEGPSKMLEVARLEGFKNAAIKKMTYKTLQDDKFFVEAIEETEPEYVVTLLQSKNEVDTNDAFFDNLPEDIKIDRIYDKNSDYYYYLARDNDNIDDANEIYSKMKLKGYANARIDKLYYDLLDADAFSIETLSNISDDFTISLFESEEKLGADHPMFDAISKEYKVHEFYNYKTNKFIYTLGKIEGLVKVFDMVDIAKKYGFNDAMVNRFVYSALNPDHFTLVPMDEDKTLFTIVIEQGNEKIDRAVFAELEKSGYKVREKYIPGKGIWIYSIGLTENIVEANSILEEARILGFGNASISRFKYEHLNEDSYYLEPLRDLDYTFMMEINSSKDKMGVDNKEFENISGVYDVKEIFDPVDSTYRYYAGKPLESEEDANTFRNELFLMGYEGVRISKVVFSALSVDMYYQDEIEEEEIKFVMDYKGDFEFFVYFGFDQYFLTKSAIDKIEDFYTNNFNVHYQILLEGYADSRGPEKYNLWLSKMRALSVKKYLLSMGVKEEKITLVAKGESLLIYKNEKQEDYNKSRRVMVRSYRE